MKLRVKNIMVYGYFSAYGTGALHMIEGMEKHTTTFLIKKSAAIYKDDEDCAGMWSVTVPVLWRRVAEELLSL